MSRLLRIEYPGAWHPAVSRERRHESIFPGSGDHLTLRVVLQEGRNANCERAKTGRDPFVFRPLFVFGRRSQTVHRMNHQVPDQGWSQGRVSWSEVASSCGVSIPVGSSLSGRVWVKAQVQDCL